MTNFKKFIAIAFITIFIASCSKEDPIDVETTKAQVKITAINTIVEEASTNGEFTFTLSNAVINKTKVNFTISGTAENGVDYQTLTTSITFLPNETTKLISLIVLEDTLLEDAETITIKLTTTENENVSVGFPNSATISIMDNASTFVLQPEQAAGYMVNPNSTLQTVALFYNLIKLTETSFIVGQQDAFSSFYNNNVGESDIKKTTGSDPGLLGSDFMFITDDNNDETASNWFYQQEQKIIADTKEAYNKGMVNVFTWHLREPYEGDEFYTSNMTDFQKNNAFKSILPGGANHEYYKSKLAKVANVANNLIGNDGNKIPFIFRPFHEFDGNWFWWGQSYCTPQEYKALWQFTVEYLRDTLNVNNILFAFSPDNNFSSEGEYLERYPGDSYVDVIGMDNYGDFNNQGQTGLERANEKLQIISKLAKQKIKVSAFTETGYAVTPGQNNPISGFFSNNLYKAMTNNNVKVSYVMFWSNYQDSYYIPVSGTSSVADFLDFVNKPQLLLQNQLPNMYQF